MDRDALTINVLYGFDGFDAERVMEIVTRKYWVRKNNNHGRDSGNPQKIVSYKGKNYTVFILSEGYGDIAGYCIDAAPNWVREALHHKERLTEMERIEKARKK